ncbi:MAG: NFYB/HAP3 family transcription factor subunit [Candidatus Micrarchaeota archaeon]|nr:NFYB/HAP3 family transcription factor subunit [Candidatus Micrarchaeota archaeon]
MANIPKQAIQKMISRSFGFKITEDAAAELARMLERKAKKMSQFAVKNASKEKRVKVTKKDIEDYVMKIGLDED